MLELTVLWEIERGLLGGCLIRAQFKLLGVEVDGALDWNTSIRNLENHIARLPFRSQIGNDYHAFIGLIFGEDCGLILVNVVSH